MPADDSYERAGPHGVPALTPPLDLASGPQNGMNRKDRQTLASSSESSHSSFQNCLTSLVFVAILLPPLVLLNGCAGLVSVGNTTASTLTISNVQAVSTATSVAQITWTTDVAANSVVNYGTTTSYGSSTPVDPTMVTTHQVALSGLSAGTTYYYEVQSTDSKNNNGRSGGHKFGTAGVSISGTITPTIGGSAATLTLQGNSSATTTANSSGAYAFTGLASGSYVVTPTNPGYSFSPASQNVVLGTTNTTGVNFSATPTTTPPTITTQPSNQTVTAGQTATFSVVASGTAPLSYQWQQGGVSIAGATGSSYTTPQTTISGSGSKFDVMVSDAAGSVTSSVATLTVNAAAVAATITTQPANQTVTAGQTATFSVVASGTAPLSYQWQKNGASIAGATSSSYTTLATTTSDSGSTFVVVVSNGAGSATSNAASLTVNAAAVAPTITTQPANQTVTAGQTATFSVVASGTAPLSYQWQKNGANIAGATSTSYTTPATIASDSGSTFRAVVTNVGGTATSNAVTLTVNPAPAAAIQVNPTSISFGNGVVGSNLSQSLTISNAGTAALTITQINVTGATFSASGYTLPLSVNAGQQTTITVGFLPTGVGSVSGSVSIVSNAPTSPTSVGLSGSGIAATLTLGASPTSLGFGNVSVGSSSSQNVTVTNTGNSNVTISSVTTSGAGFSASGLSANTILTPSQSATLSVLFAPTATGIIAGSVSVASNATNSPAVVTLSGSGVSSTSTLPTCGKLNDTNVYLPPNYDTFTPPAKGQSYTDPVFGCKITRITDAIAMGWVEATHFYNTVNAFNADDSYLFLYGSAPLIVDSSGNVVVSESNMPATNSSIEVWDTTNPKVIYYTNGNQFIKGTITGTGPNATISPTVLATFSQYSSVVIPGDMDISNDGLHIWLTNASSMGGDLYTADIFPITLNAGNGNATSAAIGTVMAGVTYHKLQIVPNNGVSVEGNGNRTIYNPNGTVYNVPGGGTNAHTDWGVDSTGKMVAASIWYSGTAQNGCPSGWGYSLLDLTSNSVRLCLNDGIQNIGNASHNSGRDTQSGHWIVFSDDDSGTCPSSSYWCFNNPTNMTGWSLYAGEILIWDDLGNTVRLAHHRSRTDENYWAQTRASISRDGKYIVFDSNYNQSATPSGANYTDVFVIGPLY